MPGAVVFRQSAKLRATLALRIGRRPKSKGYPATSLHKTCPERGPRTLSERKVWGALAVLALGILVSGCAPFPHGGRATPAQSRTRHGGGHSVPTSGKPCAANNGAGSSYVVFGRRYHVLRNADGYNKRGIASWYGPKFHGKLTSSGQPYDMYAATAANKVLPLCVWVKVTNLENGRHTVVQINDRGPFVASRIIDLSYAAAKDIGMMRKGTALVNIHVIASPSSRPPPQLTRESEEAPTPVLHHRPRLYLQLGAFLHRANAERLRAKLALQQIGHVRIEVRRVHGKQFYRVQVGPYTSVDQIDRLTTRLGRLGYSNTEVVIE
ncbi:MAG: septal ring lytic transglycosylase RlpA family protein [Gammaproteobacteria bacterium]